MLRLIVLLLVLCNAAYFAWSHGRLQAFGFAPVSQSEPQRLTQQIQPETLRLFSAQESAQAQVAPSDSVRPTVCLQAGLFDEAEGALLRGALEASLPSEAWSLDETVEPGRWMVYIGKFDNAEALTKKRAELVALNLEFELLRNPPLQWGLSLGRFSTPAAANTALEALSRRGVRTARVLQERSEVRGLMLRFPAAEDNLRAQLEALKPALAGKSVGPCR